LHFFIQEFRCEIGAVGPGDGMRIRMNRKYYKIFHVLEGTEDGAAEFILEVYITLKPI
jgi:hypothetical protein